MCAPVAFAAASFAITAGSAIAGASAQNKAEKANREAAERAFKANVKALNQQGYETEAAAAQNIFFTERQVRATRSLAAVGAGESGVAGVSAQDVLNDIEREGADITRTVARQAKFDKQAIEFAKVNQTDLMKNRISQVGKASPLAVGLQIAGAGLSFAEFQINSKPPASPDTSQ